MYKVVKKALKKSEKIHVVFLGDSKHSRSGSQIEDGEVQTLVNNWWNHPYIYWRVNTIDIRNYKIRTSKRQSSYKSIRFTMLFLIFIIPREICNMDILFIYIFIFHQ